MYLTIESNAFITLLGPSGCGKTTTLRMIAGLETPTEGMISIDGKVVFDADKGINLPPNKRDVGFLFQNYALWPHMTVYQNIAFGLENLKWDKKRIDARVKELLAMLRIEQFEKRYPSELSGGQQQRVAIARTLAPGPTVLFMDEPLSNLDAKLRMEMRTELKRLHRDTDSTFVYVTHDQLEAMTLSTRVCIMQNGLLQQYAPPLEMYNNPANLFVAGFIGMPQMNFYDAELTQENGSYAVTLDGAKVILSGEKQANLKKNDVKPGPIALGVRPEHLLLSGSEDNAIRGTVDVSEMMGSAVHLHVSACGRDTIMIVPTTEIESSAAFTIGSPIAFTFSGSTAHLFDRETQKNLEG